MLLRCRFSKYSVSLLFFPGLFSSHLTVSYSKYYSKCWIKIGGPGTAGGFDCLNARLKLHGIIMILISPCEIIHRPPTTILFACFFMNVCYVATGTHLYGSKSVIPQSEI